MFLAVFPFSFSRRGARGLLTFHCQRTLSGNSTMNVLNVAEKNDAAKNIAALLSRGTARSRFGSSKRNKIYDFEYEAFGRNVKMIMTSVRGHLLQSEFTVGRSWKSVDPIVLFEAPIKKVILPNCEDLKKTLEDEIKKCSKLIIWTDCDREGENIGFEIIGVCKAVKRDIEVYRAIFSEITMQSVTKALRELQRPRKSLSNAVEVRSELDLRIGAAFTRLQTVYLQQAFPNALNSNLISYGSCQFPTLGFVVERFKTISEFKPEIFWEISVQHQINGLVVDFAWQRNRLFDQLACEVLFDSCVECGVAKVENIETRPRIKWRPKPLDTTELQKLASRKFRISARETLAAAENLYIKGLISYPRTETNIFPKDINLRSLVEVQTSNCMWGEFAQKVLIDGPDPFQGNKSDHAHPPIHPIKCSNELTGDEKKIYEIIVRHFLACVSKHAEGLETTVDIDISGEKFTAKGLMITAKNYLEVYPYEKWSETEIHSYVKGEVFKPEISMKEGETSPPSLLTEADLISLMEKHGIGTDATHADHIETVKARLYVGLQDDIYFVPRTLGMGLIEGYNNMGYPMAKPELRAELEADLKCISNDQKAPAEVLRTHIEKYKKVYEGVQKELIHLSRAIQNYIQVEATAVESELFQKNTDKAVGKCHKCYSDLIIKTKKDGSKYIGCSSFPTCRFALWLPSFVVDVSEMEASCPTCSNHRLLRFKFRPGSCYLAPEYIGCIGGCDCNLLELLNCNSSTHTKATHEVDRIEIRDKEFDFPNENPSIGYHSNESVPMCHCGIPAFPSISRHGREYYKCSIKNSYKCNFFDWKTPTENTSETNTNCNPNLRMNEANVDIRCYCSIPCRRFVTHKEGPNKGRPFFSCGRSYQDPEKCDFFKWIDEENHNDFDNNRRHTTAQVKGYYNFRGNTNSRRSNWGRRNFKQSLK